MNHNVETFKLGFENKSYQMSLNQNSYEANLNYDTNLNNVS